MMPDIILQGILGENGLKLKLLAQGIDYSPVVCSEKVKSIGREMTFAENIREQERLMNILLTISQHIGYTARKRGYTGKTITLKVRFAPYKTVQKSITLRRATNLDNIIFQKACDLLTSFNIRQPGIRLLGIKLSSLEQGRPPQQLSFMNREEEYWEEKWSKLISSVDKIREKYGSYLIQRAALLKDRTKSTINKNYR